MASGRGSLARGRVEDVHTVARVRSVRREAAWLDRSRQGGRPDDPFGRHHDDSRAGHSEDALRDDSHQRRDRLGGKLMGLAPKVTSFTAAPPDVRRGKASPHIRRRGRFKEFWGKAKLMRFTSLLIVVI